MRSAPSGPDWVEVQQQEEVRFQQQQTEALRSVRAPPPPLDLEGRIRVVDDHVGATQWLSVSYARQAADNLPLWRHLRPPNFEYRRVVSACHDGFPTCDCLAMSPLIRAGPEWADKRMFFGLEHLVTIPILCIPPAARIYAWPAVLCHAMEPWCLTCAWPAQRSSNPHSHRRKVLGSHDEKLCVLQRSLHPNFFNAFDRCLFHVFRVVLRLLSTRVAWRTDEGAELPGEAILFCAIRNPMVRSCAPLPHPRRSFSAPRSRPRSTSSGAPQSSPDTSSGTVQS